MSAQLTDEQILDLLTQLDGYCLDLPGGGKYDIGLPLYEREIQDMTLLVRQWVRDNI